MNTLQFIDSVIRSLAWPLAIIILGLVFRAPLGEVLKRIRKLRLRDVEAELGQYRETTQSVEEAAGDVVKPLSDPGDGGHERRDQIERLIREAASLGFQSGKLTGGSTPPEVQIAWEGETPRIVTHGRELVESVEAVIERIALQEIALQVAYPTSPLSRLLQRRDRGSS